MIRDIIAGGVRLHVYERIEDERQPTIIFLHDSLGCVQLWRDFPDKLGAVAGCNVLVYDRQGYGLSAPFGEQERNNDYMEREADMLDGLIEACGLDKVILFGHSDGGSIALIYAGKYPAKVLGVITEGAHIFVEDITIGGIKVAEEAYLTTNLPQRLRKYHGDKTEAMFYAWAHTWQAEAFRSWNIERFLPGIQCPVLVMQGDSDEYGTVKQVEGIVDGAGGRATPVMIAGVGHTPHKEAEAIVLQTATAFIIEKL